MTLAGWNGSSESLHQELGARFFQMCRDAHWTNLNHNPTPQLNHLLGRILCLEGRISHFTIYSSGEYERKDLYYQDMPRAEVATLVYEGSVICDISQKERVISTNCNFGYRMTSRRGHKIIVPDYEDRWLATMEEFEDEIPLNEEEHKSEDRTDTRIYEFEEHVPGSLPFQGKGMLRKRGTPKAPLGQSKPRRKRSRLVRIPEID